MSIFMKSVTIFSSHGYNLVQNCWDNCTFNSLPAPRIQCCRWKNTFRSWICQGRRQHWSGWGREGCYIEKVTKKESSSFFTQNYGYANTFPVNINRCPKVFCTRLYPNNEKIGYTFHKNGHNSRTVKGNHIIFSGLKVYGYTFIVL